MSRADRFFFPLNGIKEPSPFTSPSIANIIKDYEFLKTTTRFILTPIIFGVKYPVVTLLILGISIIYVSNYRQIKKRF